jgi:hypothetical protein
MEFPQLLEWLCNLLLETYLSIIIFMLWTKFPALRR